MSTPDDAWAAKRRSGKHEMHRREMREYESGNRHSKCAQSAAIMTLILMFRIIFYVLRLKPRVGDVDDCLMPAISRSSPELGIIRGQ